MPKKKKVKSLQKPSKAFKPRGITSKNAKEMAEKSKLSPNTGKHGPLKTTLVLREVYKSIEEKIMRRSGGLIDTQGILARGTIKIYKIVTKEIGKGKNKKYIRERPVLVTDESEIEKVLDWEYGSAQEDPNDDTEFFFVSAQDPDNRAIKDQLDRIGLKAPQKMNFETDEKGDILGITIENPNYANS